MKRSNISNTYAPFLGRIYIPLALAAACCAGGIARAGIDIIESDDDDTQELRQTIVGVHERGDVQRGARVTGQARTVGMVYHGGPVMTGTVNVYVIWYGNWAGNTATTIIPAFLGSLGGSPYWNINTTYYNGSNVHLSNSLTFAGQTTVGYPYGTSLSDAAIQSVVGSVIGSGALPKDTNGIYFVLTSADVTASSGFCTQYCGWHAHGTIGGSDIKYSFVGNPDRCITSCSAQSVGPNGNAGADGMISIIAHEAEEAATDPDLNAWYDRQGAENADKCAWTFGTMSTAANGAKYNMTLAGQNYLVQRNWKNVGSGSCVMTYP